MVFLFARHLHNGCIQSLCFKQERVPEAHHGHSLIFKNNVLKRKIHCQVPHCPLLHWLRKFSSPFICNLYSLSQVLPQTHLTSSLEMPLRLLCLLKLILCNSSRKVAFCPKSALKLYCMVPEVLRLTHQWLIRGRFSNAQVSTGSYPHLTPGSNSPSCYLRGQLSCPVQPSKSAEVLRSTAELLAASLAQGRKAINGRGKCAQKRH